MAPAPSASNNHSTGLNSIIDLRGQDAVGDAPDSHFLRNQIIAGLCEQMPAPARRQPEDTPYSYSKTLPTLILYDDHGLSLYDDITSLEEYYPFKAEIRILQAFGLEIAHRLFGHILHHDQLVLNKNRLKQLAIVDDAPQVLHSDDARSAFSPPNHAHACRKTKERWGDHCVGSHNHGVNGNLGLTESTPQHGCIIELGAGSLKKTAYLLEAVASLLPRPPSHPNVGDRMDKLKSAQYFALDVVPAQLTTTLEALPTDFCTSKQMPGKVHTQGLCATYDEGLEWIKSQPEQLSAAGTRRCIVWLGSSIGNLSRREATTFLKGKVAPVLREGDTLLIGVDNCQDTPKVELAYDDPHGVTARFALNAVAASGKELGVGPEQGWKQENFEYVSRYNVELSRHEAYLRARQDIEFAVPSIQDIKHSLSPNGSELQIKIAKGELIGIEHSYKFSHEMMYKAFIDSGLRLVQQWTDPSPNAYHTLYLVERPRFTWPSITPVTVNGTVVEIEAQGKAEVCQASIPTIEEWQKLWSTWDLVTTEMIPEEQLFQKPIDLRHICLFYLGHIPTFADIQISRCLKEPFTEPRKFSQIFERGIDPNMEDPTQCHDHSVIPETADEWPTLDQVLDFRDRFRQRLFKLYKQKVECPNGPDRYLGRVLSMIYEHEALHVETLLYMLIQMPVGDVRPPPGFMEPDWKSLSRHWHSFQNAEATKAFVVQVSAATFKIGQNDLECEDSAKPYDPKHSYGWDNESPCREVHVKPFQVESVPITNRRYLDYLERLGQDSVFENDIPSSWIKVNGSNAWSIRTIYGPVPFEVADLWPCQASGTQLTKFAESVGGRLPTETELRYWFDRYCSVDSAVSNIGFRNWHPLPPTSPVRQVHMKKANEPGAVEEEEEEEVEEWIGGSNGGVWEWTSSAFQAHEGFSKSVLYPGYSSDFFDGLHLVLLGGSWATIPRLAGRRSFRNWYQANYPYVFAGARVVYDL